MDIFVCLSFVVMLVIVGILIYVVIEDKKSYKELKEMEKLKEKVEKEKEQTLEKISSGDNQSDFDNSINILHNYSSRGK